MFYFLKGCVEGITNESVILNVCDVGYEIFVSKPDKFCVGEEYKIHTHLVIREDEQYLIGFSSLLEKETFLSLISVKGIGPKIALGVLAKTTPEMLKKAISANNVAFLKHLPGIGTKAASQIILDLKGQITGTKGNPDQYDDIRDALKQLGYKNKIIDSVLCEINETDASNDEILAIALKKLRNM